VRQFGEGNHIYVGQLRPKLSRSKTCEGENEFPEPVLATYLTESPSETTPGTESAENQAPTKAWVAEMQELNKSPCED
jgi:hypothetical protein